MKPLIVLLLVFVVASFTVRMVQGSYAFALPARIAMAVMLLFTAMAHFKFDQGMAMMIPDFVPLKLTVVHVTGVLEIAAAVGILIPASRPLAAWLLIAFLVLILPANIHAALHHVNYQNGTLDGQGPGYLWFRVPLQLFFIAWVYLSCLRA